MESSTGFVISTFGSPAYIDLQLALHKGKWHHDCLVVDDGSGDKRLIEVCNKWETPLVGVNSANLGHQKGDAKAYGYMVSHFADKDFVFKISRRFLWLKDFSKELPIGDFIKSPVLSDWWVPHKGWQNNRAFTSCCLGFYIPALSEKLKVELVQLPNIVKEPPSGAFVEPVLFKLFRLFFDQPLTIWRSLYKQRGRELVGLDVLWKNNAIPYQYKLLSDILDLHWSLQDFQI